MAYNWSIAENKWNLIGNVTGSAEEKPKYKGKVSKKFCLNFRRKLNNWLFEKHFCVI